MHSSIGYLGPGGSYSEAVCMHLFPKKTHAGWYYQQYPSLADLLDAANKKAVTYAVFPIENSKTGLLNDNQGNEIFYRLGQAQAVQVVAEKFWPLQFLLMGVNGASIHTIETLHLNPYAEQQCTEYLQNHRKWQIITHNSSSAAAEMVNKNNNVTHAALASKEAAQTYGLTVLDEHIFTPGEEPVMHFLVAGSQPLPSNIEQPKKSKVSTFWITVESLDDFMENVRQAKIRIGMLRKSAYQAKGYYIDVMRDVSVTMLQRKLSSAVIMKRLGSFYACEQRKQYQTKFPVLCTAGK